MKKYLAVLLAIVLTLSFFTFTVSAADDTEITPYALLCPECGNAMRAVKYYTREGHFKVLSCDDYNWSHLHFEVYVQTNWECRTSGCSEFGYEIIGADPIYSHTECGLKD